MPGLAVGLDIGGTKIAGALVASDGSVLERSRSATPAEDPDEIVTRAAAVAADLASRHGDGAPPVGVSAAGLVDRAGMMRYAPNIAWADYPLAERLEAAIAGPVVVENDGAAAAWGEFRCGAGGDAADGLVMLTLGTGVGGGHVHRGALVRGAHGLGAEFGHLLVAEGGAPCPCGNFGCLEAYASGTAIGRAARERLEAGAVPAGSPLHGLDDVTGEAVTEAALAGDEAALEVLAETGFWLGVGMASLVNALDPELVVVGGGAMRAGELLLAPAREAMALRVLGHRHRQLPPVVPATLGGDAGTVGAALLALEPGAG